MSDVLVKVENVSKKFCRSLKRSLRYGMQDLGNEVLGRRHGGDGILRPEEFWAVDDVSFELKRGECLGLIGLNGAGKTTLLRMLNGLIKPDKGRIEMRGSVGALIALGAGFNPILTGRENIYVNASILGLSKREIDKKLDDIIDFADLSEFIDSPVQSYSSGMQVRLGFAVATAMEPDVLLLDEVLAVGDVAFRGKCFKRIGAVLTDSAVIFVSHSEPQVRRICNRAILMESGAALFSGNTADALRLYREHQTLQAPLLRLVKDNCVTSFDVINMPKSVAWGNNLSFKIGIRLTQRVSVAHILVHFAKDGEFVAHAETQFDALHNFPLDAGENILSLNVGPMHLSHGKYDLSFSVFDESGKHTVLQAFDFAAAEIKGPVGSGPANLIPMVLRTGSNR